MTLKSTWIKLKDESTQEYERNTQGVVTGWVSSKYYFQNEQRYICEK